MNEDDAGWPRHLLGALDSRNYHHLRIVGHVHAEVALDYWSERSAGRNTTYVALQLRSPRVELKIPLLERSDLTRLLDARGPPPDDACCDQNETDEDEGQPGPAGPRYAARHARSRALRARGFVAISSSEATTGLRVSVSPSARPRHVHIG